MRVVITIIAAIATLAVWAGLLGILSSYKMPFKVGDGIWFHEAANAFTFILCVVGIAGSFIGFLAVMIKVWNKD